MTQCVKIIVGCMANVGNVFIKRLQTFIYFSPRFLRFFIIFLNFYLNVYYIYAEDSWIVLTTAKEANKQTGFRRKKTLGKRCSIVARVKSKKLRYFGHAYIGEN